MIISLISYTSLGRIAMADEEEADYEVLLDQIVEPSTMSELLSDLEDIEQGLLYLYKVFMLIIGSHVYFI